MAMLLHPIFAGRKLRKRGEGMLGVLIWLPSWVGSMAEECLLLFKELRPLLSDRNSSDSAQLFIEMRRFVRHEVVRGKRCWRSQFQALVCFDASQGTEGQY